ncbi:polymorphic toxin-type HINT domain-containing protein [Micromonospora chersina]|uniref:polymorphic toxin-type HINT domain-containing protein n=1 Tax=Micromonospora chersina TaxID=47854 RepID=UPI00371BF84F
MNASATRRGFGAALALAVLAVVVISSGDIERLTSAQGCPTGSCDPGPSNSFTVQTLVLTASGDYRPIGELRAGDQVLSADPVSGARSTQPVLRIASSTGTKAIVVISASEGSWTATSNHLFWLPWQGRWSRAGDLVPGDTLGSDTGATVTVVAVRRETRAATSVANIDVARFRTYFVHAGGRNVLVHS